MQLHDLTPAPGSTKNRKRVGRGNSSGHGTTSGRGQKGQGSRSGGTDGAALKAARITKSEFEPVKVLGNGELTKKFTVKVDKVSASAQAKIEAAGGKVELPC